MNFDEMNKILDTQEELHPDLKEYLEELPPLGLCLRHPLVFSVPYCEQMNCLHNKQYKSKKEEIDKALIKKDWGRYLFFHERPYRFTKFLDICQNMSDEDYWTYLGEIWIDSENLWQYKLVLENLLSSNRSYKEKMMNKEDKELLDKLPNEFVIYRGHQEKNKKGHSWTLSYWKAHWFAERFQRKLKNVTKAIVKKEDIHAILTGRGELEVVVSPNKLKFVSIRKIKRPQWIENILKLATKNYSLSRSYHGIRHWEKVERNALTLAKHVKADKTVVQLFSLIHDSKRENEDDDSEHGLRAALWVEELFNNNKLEINREQLQKLKEACEFHDKGEISNDPTIGVCWDADRLDLTRVNIIPEEKYLSTKAAKELLWKI